MDAPPKVIATAVALLIAAGLFTGAKILHQPGQLPTPDFPSPTAAIMAPSKAKSDRPAVETSSASPLEQLLRDAETVASVEQKTPGGLRRLTLHHTSFKHPMVRLVEEFADGAAGPGRVYAMMADLALIRLRDGDRERLTRFLQEHPEARVRESLDTGEHVLVQFPLHGAPDAFDHWQGLLHAAGLDTAGPDYLYQIGTTPNDPQYSQLWGLHNSGQNSGTADADMDAPEAWNITTGSNSVTVAILDVGVDYNHPDLATNIWSHPTTGKHGYDYYQNDDDPMDPSSTSAQAHGHGTHIAGTIAGVGNNGVGVVGVCWNAKIMAMRIGGADGNLDTAAAISAMRYATDNGAKAMNCSWGGGGGSQGDSLSQEIAYARDHGVIVACAAGNGGPDHVGDNNDSSAQYPANYNVDNVISVAASDRNDNLTSFSNYGATTVDIAAPGSAIYSTLPNNQYASHDGTSMATPQVTGAAALVWAASPALTYSQVRSRLLTRVDAKASMTGKVASGGRLNVFNAIQDLAGPVLTLNRKQAVTTGGNGDTYPNPGETVRLDLTLENTGSETATACTIAASLSSGAPASINRSSFSVGNLASHTTSVQDNAFILTLNNNVTLPATFTVTLTLSTSVRPAPWTDSIQITVYESATLRGLVTRASTGEPIPGATITARGPVNLDLTTGSDGRYQASSVAGSYQISAAASGLIGSEIRSETLGASSGDINFALGTAALTLAPATINLTVPPNQTRNLTASACHAGDTPRTIPFETSINGTGLSVQQLLGFDFQAFFTTGGPIKVYEVNPATGASAATHNVTASNAQQNFLGAAPCQGKLWLLASEWTQSGPVYALQQLDTTTWTLGASVSLTPPAGVDFMGMAAVQDKLLLTARNNNTFSFSLYSYLPSPGTLTPIGALPQNTRGAIAYSASRSSIFISAFSTSGPGDSVKELAYPALTSIREWNPSAQVINVAYDEIQAALFIASAPLSGGSGPSMSKRNPTTGATIAGFTAVGNVTLPVSNSTSGAGWIHTPLASSDVANDSSRAIPLVVDTTGMTLGQSFTAQLHVTSSLAAEPTPLTVNLTVGTLDPTTWEGWFEIRYGRGPQAADRDADPDLDGVSTYLEFTTGGDPENPLPHPGLPVGSQTADGAAFEFSFLRRKNLPAGSLVAQLSNNLADWTTAPAGATTAVDADFERVTITIPVVGDQPAFLRLNAP